MHVAPGTLDDNCQKFLEQKQFPLLLYALSIAYAFTDSLTNTSACIPSFTTGTAKMYTPALSGAYIPVYKCPLKF